MGGLRTKRRLAIDSFTQMNVVYERKVSYRARPLGLPNNLCENCRCQRRMIVAPEINSSIFD
jgi:hypothetical protein